MQPLHKIIICAIYYNLRVPQEFLLALHLPVSHWQFIVWLTFLHPIVIYPTYLPLTVLAAHA